MLPVPVDPSGRCGPTRKQARGSGWRRTSHGHYVPAAVPVTADQRVVEASVLAGVSGAVTGWAALEWLGERWSDGLDPAGALRAVPVVAPGHGARGQQGFLVVNERLTGSDVMTVDGIRVTTPARSACFEACRAADVRAAVRWFDLPATWDLFSLAEAGEHLAAMAGRRGHPQARAALALASENCWSPAEVGMRMIWTLDLGISGLLCNQPVFDLAGNHLGTPDLLDPVAGVVGEYDSQLHWGARGKDVRREGRFRRAGLECVAMVGTDRAGPSDFMQRTVDAYDRARRRTTRPTWTLEGPPWWRWTQTVAQRRALSEWDRARWLRWQVA